MLSICAYGEYFEIKQNYFPDSSLNMSINCYKDDVSAIIWNYENDAELFSLICLRRSLADDIDLVIPYLPHARMDRVKNHTDVFTLKYFAEVINSLHFNRVFTLDVHSNVALALIDRIQQYDVFEFIDKATKELEDKDIVPFFPDEGAMKRYSRGFHKEFAFGIKNREWETGKILGLDIINKEVVKDRNVLIVDDICSKGGTFYHSAKALKDAGAKDIFLYVTHAEHTMTSGDIYNGDLVSHIYTTDSIFKKEWDTKNKVSIFEIF